MYTPWCNQRSSFCKNKNQYDANDDDDVTLFNNNCYLVKKSDSLPCPLFLSTLSLYFPLIHFLTNIYWIRSFYFYPFFGEGGENWVCTISSVTSWNWPEAPGIIRALISIPGKLRAQGNTENKFDEIGKIGQILFFFLSDTFPIGYFNSKLFRCIRLCNSYFLKGKLICFIKSRYTFDIPLPSLLIFLIIISFLPKIHELELCFLLLLPVHIFPDKWGYKIGIFVGSK